MRLFKKFCSDVKKSRLYPYPRLTPNTPINRLFYPHPLVDIPHHRILRPSLSHPSPDQAESQKQPIPERGPQRIEDHIIDVRHPEGDPRQAARQPLRQLDGQAEEHPPQYHLLHAGIRNEGQPEAEGDHQQNVQQRGLRVGGRQRDEGDEVQSLAGGKPVQHQARVEQLHHDQRLKLEQGVIQHRHQVNVEYGEERKVHTAFLAPQSHDQAGPDQAKE